MHFVHVARGLERENKLCADVLLIQSCKEYFYFVFKQISIKVLWNIKLEE